jgi:hypothetical protein
MKRLILILSIFLLLASVAFGKGYEAKRNAGEYEIKVKIDKNPPVAIGDNHIEIEIRDGAGKYVTDAKVLVNYYMPPMPRMAPMNYKTDAKLKREKYRATMHFIMAGPWVIAIKVTRDGKTVTTKLNVDAQ